jgi:hypothetical protein
MQLIVDTVVQAKRKLMNEKEFKENIFYLCIDL